MKTYTHTIIEKSTALTAQNSRYKKAAARVLLCLMLTLAMVFPMAVPADVYASTETSSSESTSVSTSKKQTISGYKLAFDNKVITESRLSYVPTNLNATGNRKSIKLTWKAVSSPSKIDGYIIVRKNSSNNTWYEVAKVSKNSTSYTDKTAKTKNRYYCYSVLAYDKQDGNIKISAPAAWAGALTTRSSKKNVYSIAVSNPANVKILMVGSCAQTYLNFNKKAYSRYIRWTSSNKAVATVDSAGLLTGVAPGTATIYIKTHTGTYSSFTVTVVKGGTADAMIKAFSAWKGYSRLNGRHKSIIDIYNSMTPWPKGYKMKYSDAWCDATITAAAIKTGNVDKIGRECSVPRHIKIFQSLGIWEEDGTITPKPGDIIVYSWRKFKQPNNASASHIGLVVKVENGKITCIEGNRGIGVVATRTIPVGWGCIRGYARPHYSN